MAETSNSGDISPRLQRIAELARTMPGKELRTLAHHIDLDFLREAFRRTRKDGAVGVDGRTAAAYAADLEGNLQSLLNRAKSGTYRAPAVRRVNIPKGDGRSTRPLGIPTFEDKVLQRAVAMVLEAVYEQDFRSCSYGFRPGRSAHDALQALWEGLMGRGGGWVLEVDIRKFFDNLDHGHLRQILRQRVRDGVLLRLIGKWLNAGVLDEGRLIRPTTGTPQGGVISPLLANIYLHEALDVWFEQEVKPRLRGQGFLIRYADDFVMVFSSEEDARRVWTVLPKRFAKYGLDLHPEKTKLCDLRRPDRRSSSDDGDEGPGTLSLLGFTHFWARSRKGNWVVKKKTAKDRLCRAIRSVADWCRRHRHWKIRDQHTALVRKLRGHCAYFGVTGNSQALRRFRHAMERVWFRWLGRRSQRAPKRWNWFHQLKRRYRLPPALAIHSTFRPVANP